MRAANTVNGLFNAVEDLTTSARLHKPTGRMCLELHPGETRSEEPADVLKCLQQLSTHV